MSIYSDRLNKPIDNIYAVLLLYSEVEYLPELYEIFGRSHIMKFLNIFSGTTIRVPTVVEIERCARDVKIWLLMKESVSNVNTIMKEFGVRKKDVKTIYDSVESKFKSMGVRYGDM